jgi:hypothetical protein
MDPITPTEKHDVNGGQTQAPGAALVPAAPAAPATSEPVAGEDATVKLPTLVTATEPPARVQGASPLPPTTGLAPATELKPPLAPSARESCPVCASAVAPDQRYCVECGQRLAAARPAFMNDRVHEGAAPPPKKRSHWSANTTLLAGIATLLLAMGVGILIGYLGHGSNTKPTAARQIVEVPSTGATGAASTGATGETSSSAAAKAPTSNSSSSGGKAASSKPTQAATKPANPSVQLGQKGSGAGYQHHEFTGHFFGKENEENAGEEGEEESSKGGKK